MATATNLIAYPVHYPSPSVRFLAEAWWTCRSSGSHTWRNRSDCILATDLPLSVVCPGICDNLELELSPVPGWKGRIPSYQGITCRIGLATLWLAQQDNPGQYRSFSLLTLIPQTEPIDAPPFIHLGAQFLLQYQVQVSLDANPTGKSQMVIP
jgi:hypothetical protein